MTDPATNELAELAEISPNLPTGDAAQGIAAIALTMALKYHDIATVQDGTLYQQYKLEGKNFRELHLDMVFETAMQIEAHLVGASDRIASIVFAALTAAEPDIGPEDEG